MVEPVAFGFNEETAANNYFQQRTVAAGETVQACALKEFRGMVDKLRANGIEVIAVQDTPIPHTPDSIFPNNWVSFHDDGTVVLYPMFAENRRAERRADILQRIESEGFSIRRKVDYTGFEEENRFLEGTGGIILDRVNRYAYAALSQRVDEALLGRFCKEQNFSPVSFHAYQTVNGQRLPIYHTNVMMCVATDYAVVCLDSIDDVEEREQVYQAMADNFGVDTSEITFDNISSTVSKEMSQNAMKAVIIAVVCMLLYIWIRFRDIRFASSAILALMHDIAIVFGFYVVSRISVGSTFIACMLTILGYSINSTIVIFDRIRENLPELKREPIESLVDRCITDTLTRSIYSSLTTFITIFVLFVMGVSSIRDFAAPLMVGIVCGAYTSVCITGALWYVMKHVGKNKYVPSKAVQNKTKNK